MTVLSEARHTFSPFFATTSLTEQVFQFIVRETETPRGCDSLEGSLEALSVLRPVKMAAEEGTPGSCWECLRFPELRGAAPYPDSGRRWRLYAY